jgi:hypothetical protein
MEILDIFEQIAENGHAPKEGCRLFGVGYEDTFQRLRSVYLESRFSRGKSAEKFVVGIYGSGKTHFLRTLSELAREMNCVTVEVAFNKDIDPSQSLPVYAEVTREVRAPQAAASGMRELLRASLELVGSKAHPRGTQPEDLQTAWVQAVDGPGLALPPYGKVLRQALEAMMSGQDAVVDAACQWLEGAVSDRSLAVKLGVPHYPKAEHNLIGRRALLSLLQFVRRAGFQGTVIGFDEADQGLSMIEGRKLQRILSMFMSGINALQDMDSGSAFVVYAVTPQIIEKMMEFPALQQRVVDPAADQGFFSGNTMAPQIPLALRPDRRAELREIADNLVVLFASRVLSASPDRRDALLAQGRAIADRVTEEEATTTARRQVARQVCTMLLRGAGLAGSPPVEEKPEAEV